MQGMSNSGLSLEVPHARLFDLAQWQWIKQILDFSDQVRNINLKTLSNVSLFSSYYKAEGGTDRNAVNLSGFTHAQISWFPNPQPALEPCLCCTWQTLQSVAAWNNPGLWHSLHYLSLSSGKSEVLASQEGNGYFFFAHSEPTCHNVSCHNVSFFLPHFFLPTWTRQWTRHLDKTHCGKLAMA